jgi:hydroxypyruvate reductase
VERHNEHLLQILNAAIRSVQPSTLIPRFFKQHQLAFEKYEKIYVAGAGKASAAMAKSIEDILGKRVSDGMIAVKHGHALPLQYCRQIEAGHPLPDERSLIAAKQLIELFKKATENDLIIFLLSGGASSLITDVPPGISFEDLNYVIDKLLRSGATIKQLNTVRRQLSQLKGGELVKYANDAEIIGLIISDVPGDDIAVIGSGPTVYDDSSPRDAIDILYKYLQTIPQTILHFLETRPSKPSSQQFGKVSNCIIGDNQLALNSAARTAEQLGYETSIYPGFLSGDAIIAATSWVREIISKKDRTKCCYIAGGETTVKVKGDGLGGRNQHFALAAAKELKSADNITLLAAGTDGTDGPTDANGAIVNSSTWTKDAEEYFNNNDSYHFFAKAGGQIKTGPTQTNVMDIVITLVNPG